jgi:hypothetical protein
VKRILFVAADRNLLLVGSWLGSASATRGEQQGGHRNKSQAHSQFSSS